MKNTVVAVAAAVLVAVAGTYVLVQFVRGAEERALAGQQTVDVLIVRENIPRGTPVEELSAFVNVARVPLNVRADGSVATLDDLAGQVTQVELVQGEQLLAARFGTREAVESAQGVAIPPGLQLITLSLAPQRALGGQIVPGDIVGVFGSFLLTEAMLDGDASTDAAAELWQSSKAIVNKLLVTNVQVEQLPQAPPENEDGVRGPGLAPTGNLLITLAVDVPQAERIVFASEYGTIWLTAQDAATDESGSTIRTLRNIYDD